MQSNELQQIRESSLKLKEEILRNATDKSGKKMMNPLKLPEIFTYFDTPGKEKKWTAPNADLTDYFNYGFTEETFKAFSHKVKALFGKLQKTGGAHFKQSGESDKFYEDRVPISHGGLEIIDDKALKEIAENTLNLLSFHSDNFLDQTFTAQEHSSLDNIRKGIYEVNNSVNNVYGLKKEPPPNPPTPLIQPPVTLPTSYSQARPQPPGLPPPRMNPPPMGMPNMFQPPMPHPMEYPNFPPMMNPRNPYMGFPQKPFDFNPMYPHGMMPGGRPPMEMDTEIEDKKFEKKRREEKSDESEESSDEREKGKSQSKTSERKKKSRSKERKHRHHRSDKDDSESRHHHHHHHRDRYDREEKSSRREKYSSRDSKERERDEAKYEGSYKTFSKDDDGKSQGRERRDWQKGYINNLIGTQKGNRDKKDKRSK